jgi:glycosyltransferase involved in cell wall biosynthesis
MRQVLAAVVPCYNVGERVRPVVERLTELSDHVFLVDDGSTDGAVEGLRDLPAHIIVLQENRGKGNAMLQGFRAALELPQVTHVAIVDADGQHDPSELPRLFEAVANGGADFVIGSRSFGMGHVPLRSRLGNQLTALITRILLKRPVPDTQSGYRLHSRRLLEDVLANVSGGRYETEMEILVLAVRKGYKVASVPIKTIYEEGNPASHFNKLKDSFRIYRSLFRAVGKHRPSI